MNKQRIMVHVLARPSGNGGETNLDIKEGGSKRWCSKCDVRHTEILITGRREECLCPRHTSHKARALQNPECGSHLGRDLPLHQPLLCGLTQGSWCWLQWAGAFLGSWSSWSRGHCLPGHGQPLLSTAPVPFRGSLAHSWRTFLALLGGHRDLCPSTHLVAFLWGIYGSSLTSLVTCLNKWFEYGD